MRYGISKRKAPKMPNLGKGTECIKLLLSQASKVMHDPLFPMLFPVLGAHISDSEFQYPDLVWKEPTGIMANLVAKSGVNKGQLSLLVEAICRPTTSDLAGCLLRLSGLSAPTWLGDGDEGCAK